MDKKPKKARPSIKAEHIDGKWRAVLNRTQAKPFDTAATLADTVADLTNNEHDRALAASLRAFLCRYAADQVDGHGELLAPKNRETEQAEPDLPGEGEGVATGLEPGGEAAA